MEIWKNTSMGWQWLSLTKRNANCPIFKRMALREKNKCMLRTWREKTLWTRTENYGLEPATFRAERLLCITRNQSSSCWRKGRSAAPWDTWEEVCIGAYHELLWDNTQYRGLPQSTLSRAGVKRLWSETVLRLKNVFKRKMSVSKTVQKWMEFRNVIEKAT